MTQTYTCSRISLLFLLCMALSGRVQAQMPVNIDFGLGNFTNWSCYAGTATYGTAATGPFFTGAVLTGPIAGPPSRHKVISRSPSDPYGDTTLLSSGGNYALKIGNSNVGAEAERARYYIHVPAGTTKFSITYQFAVVFEDPGHSQPEQPSFQVVAYDSATGVIIPSANNLFVAGPSLPGFTPLASSPGVLFRPWSASTINLSGRAGTTVILDVTSSDCVPAGHFGYGYFDAVSYANYLAPTVTACNLGGGTISLKAPPGYKYYQWFDQTLGTALNSSTDTSPNITLPIPATPQYYNVILVPYFAGGTPDTVRTNLISGFSLSTTPAPPVACVVPGTPVQLMASVTGGSGSLTYQWTGDSSLNAFNIAGPVATPVKPSTYIVKVSDTNGCFRVDTVQLRTGTYNVHAGADTTTCLGTAVRIPAAVSPGSTAYTYTWLPASGLSGTSVLNPVYTPGATGVQQLILRVDSGACTKYDTISIRTLPNSFLVSDTAVCTGTSVTPFVQGDTAFAYTWSPAARLSFPTPAAAGSDQQPVFSADTTTTFTITASYPGCPAIVKQLTVGVDPIPVVSIGSDTIFKTSATPAGITASVLPGTFTGYTYAWSPNGFIDSVNRPNIVFSGITDTLLILTVTTPAGCTDADSVQIMVSNTSIMSVPNAFTPAGAQNNLFRVVRIEPDYTLRSFRVYNRWGRKVFETGNPGDGWNGSFNGTAQPMGVYVYIAEAVSSNGRSVRQQGSVTLIR